MGKTEKLVVLAVLFAAALVLAISFNRGGKVEAADPLRGAQSVLEREGALEEPVGSLGDATPPPGPSAPDEAAPDASAGRENAAPGPTSADGKTTSLLLNAGVGPESATLASDAPRSALSLEPESDPSHRILVDTVGTRPSFLAEFMMYTVGEGDTWSSLAQRFYRDGRYTRNLRLANEDLDRLTPGKDILVPVFDFLAVDAGLQPGAGADPVAAGAGDAPAPAASQAPSFAPPPSAGSASPAGSARLLEYEVRSGDTLSDISVAVFGTATRWKELLEANRDKLQRPESLRVGMKLKIPEGGKLPPPAKKTEPEPKASEGSAKTAGTGGTTKKKKVL
jgi:nucleoid-associated protein YgaU